MVDHSILFSDANVLAIRAGRKTQTRRLAEKIKRDPADSRLTIRVHSRWMRVCPGDTLWVREGFAEVHQDRFEHRAGHEGAHGYGPRVDVPWRSGRQMPRRACRLTLTLTEVRVQRLHDITEDDAIAEGIAMENVIFGANGDGGRHNEITADRYFYGGGPDEGFEDGVSAFAALWNAIHSPRAWKRNPLVVAMTFAPLFVLSNTSPPLSNGAPR
jgi:hypothetical protein